MFAPRGLAQRLGAIPLRDAQGAAHAADGAARASGTPAIVACSGLADSLKVASGLVTAHGDRQPVVGVVELTTAEQELALSALGTAARSVIGVGSGEAASEAVRQCAAALQGDGPVVIVVDPDVDLPALVGALAAGIGAATRSGAPAGGPDSWQPFLAPLRESRKPVILLGHGAATGADLAAVTALARSWQAPICLTFAATSMPAGRLEELVSLAGADVPVLPAGTVPWTTALTRADRLLALGSGLSEADWFGLGDARLVRAPVTRVVLEAEPDGVAEQTVSGEAGAFARALTDELVRGGTLTRGDWLGRFADARSKWSGLVDAEANRGLEDERLTAALAAREIVSAAPADAILIGEGGAAGMWLASYAWLRPLMLPAQHASIGASIAMAAGAAAAEPDRAVWCVVGDGAFFYCARELAGLAERGVPLAVFVFDDRSWNAIRLVQTLFFRHRTIGTDLPDVDYGQHADLHGCDTVRARTPGDMAMALSLAQEPRPRPLVVDVRLAKGSIPFVGANLILAELDGVLGTLAGSAAAGGVAAAAKDRPALAANLRVTLGALRR